jgi:hypothetical protein
VRSGIVVFGESVELSPEKQRMQEDNIHLNVADLVVSLTNEPGICITGHVPSFLVDAPPQASVNLHLDSGDGRLKDRHQVAVSEHLGWKAFATADRSSILVERIGGRVKARFSAEAPCQLVDVFVSNRRSAGSDEELLLVEVLPLPVVALLSGHQGLFLHSCAVALEQDGILFTGVSGSGKSTMAGLWHRFGPPSSRVIDDEHILARQVDESALLYGAPWSRGPRAATFSRTPLKAVFFLSHSRQNQCITLSPSEALAEFLSQVFLPLWSRDQLELTLQTGAALLQGVPCYQLPFFPDERVVGFVQEVIGGRD